MILQRVNLFDAFLHSLLGSIPTNPGSKGSIVVPWSPLFRGRALRKHADRIHQKACQPNPAGRNRSLCRGGRCFVVGTSGNIPTGPIREGSIVVPWSLFVRGRNLRKHTDRTDPSGRYRSWYRGGREGSIVVPWSPFVRGRALRKHTDRTHQGGIDTSLNQPKSAQYLMEHYTSLSRSTAIGIHLLVSFGPQQEKQF